MSTYNLWLIPYPDNAYIPSGSDGLEQVVVPKEALNALRLPGVESIFLRPKPDERNTAIFVTMKDGRHPSEFLWDLNLLQTNCLVFGSRYMLSIIWKEFMQEGIELPTYLSERNLVLCAIGKEGFIPITPVVLPKS